MIERLIKNNISLLNHHLVMGYLEGKGIYPTEDEAIIICNFLKENYQILLKDNSVLLSLKGNIREEIFNGIFSVLLNLKNSYL